MGMDCEGKRNDMTYILPKSKSTPHGLFTPQIDFIHIYQGTYNLIKYYLINHFEKENTLSGSNGFYVNSVWQS